MDNKQWTTTYYFLGWQKHPCQRFLPLTKFVFFLLWIYNRPVLTQFESSRHDYKLLIKVPLSLPSRLWSFKYSLINMRQLQILYSKPKLDMRLFADLADFTCFYQFLHELLIKLVFFNLQNNLMSSSCKNL